MLHVYGVVEAGHQLPDGLTGVHDEPVRLASARRVAVAVSPLPADAPAGPPEIAAHARVLEELLLGGSVLPMRFGLAVPDEATAVAELKQGERGYLRALRLVRGHAEFNVKVFHDEDALLDLVAHSSPRVRAAAGRGGTDLLARVELGELVAEEMTALREADAARVVEVLTPLAAAVSYGAPVAGAAVNVSFLVPDERADAFRKQVSRVAEDGEDRTDVRCSGPLPPYSFVDVTRGG